MKNQLLKLTEVHLDKTEDTVVFIGTQHIIKMKSSEIQFPRETVKCTKIKSVGAMVDTTFVRETLAEIEALLNSN